MFSTSKDKNAANEAGTSAADDIKNTARNVKNDMRDGVSAVKDDLSDVAHRSGQHFRDMAESASDNVASFSKILVDRIRDKPVQSSLIAAGVGLFFGMIWTSKR